jgi:hypothetical protein
VRRCLRIRAISHPVVCHFLLPCPLPFLDSDFEQSFRIPFVPRHLHPHQIRQVPPVRNRNLGSSSSALSAAPLNHLPTLVLGVARSMSFEVFQR